MMDNLAYIKRPKPEDDEDDLLRMQQEFYEKKLSPSAKVINLRSQKTKTDQPIKKQSKFAKDRNIGSIKNRIYTSQICGSVTNVGTENLDISKSKKSEEKKIDPINNYVDLSTSVILGNIVERKLNLKEFKCSINKGVEYVQDGFPSVFTSLEMLPITSSKESLFKQTISKQMSNHSTSISSSQDETSITICKSNIITGPLAEEIHEENLKKIKEMSKDEIVAEQKNLEAMLDPATIAFIKSIKNLKNKSRSEISNTLEEKAIAFNNVMEVKENIPSYSSKQSINSKMEVDDRNLDMKSTSCEMDIGIESSDLELPYPVMNILKNAEKKGWVHMDDLEPEKMKWMNNLPENEDTIQTLEEPYNARFDFNGTLLPFKDENLTVDKGLHHHGEEPDRPGYSLEELLQLSRSATQQQRSTALTTLANILEKTYLGWYDQALQPALLKTLNQKNILLLLRFSLDDSALSVVTAALQALRAFLFSETDEICLDKTFGIDDFEEPLLKPTIKDLENTDNLKDHELAQIDTIAALLRSDIILRIRFLLNNMQLSAFGMTAALEILTRLARHSHETTLNIACTQDLLNVIVQKCIPISMSNPVQNDDSSKAFGCPLVAAVRLCRILTMYGGPPIAEQLKDLQIIHSLFTYISQDASKQNVRLHIESLRLWRLFLHYGIELDSIVGSRLTLISQLRLLVSTLNLNDASPLKCDYAAALIAIAKYDEPLKEHVSVLLLKWSTQLSSLATPNWNNTILIAETLKTLDNVFSLKRDWIKNSKIFSQLSSSSNLLSNLEFPSDRYPSSLPSLSVMAYEGKLQPIIDQHSQIVFLKTILEFFLKNSCYEELMQIFNSTNFYNYLQRLKNSSTWSLERSWFTRLEYSLLITVIQIDNQRKIFLNTEIKDTIWKIAIKLISALPADCPLNVRDVLVYSLLPERINLRFLETGMSKLNLSEEYRNIEGLDNTSLAIKLYEKFVSSNGNWSEAAMPKDWLYLPLVDTFTRTKNQKSCQLSNTVEILNLLKLELIMPELTKNLSPTLRFSRMLLLYLCESAFVHPPECELPQKIITKLVQANYKKFDLCSGVPGLVSFTDLFTALCENFVANSYGQDCFSQALLVFIAQRYDVHFRKLLWSEHAGVLPYCRVTSDKLIIPLQEYLYPLEYDTSLIEAYITALVRNTVRENHSPVLYNIAVHHSAMYLKEMTKLATLMKSRIQVLLTDPKTTIVAEKLLNYTPSVTPL